jgi:uncharacterized protein YbjT (DUF2867 family)
VTQKVLIAGATGMLGSRIAYYLLEQPETELRLLVRPGSLSDARKAGRISSLIERSAVVAHGDLTNRESLEHATKDVDVVISAVQGDREIIIDGQLALLDVATMNGVRRMMPADFAGDLFEAPEGGHPLLGMRHTVDRVIAASGIEHVHILNGFFMAAIYHLYALTGVTALRDLQNGRYPDIHPESFEVFLRRTRRAPK